MYKISAMSKTGYNIEKKRIYPDSKIVLKKYDKWEICWIVKGSAKRIIGMKEISLSEGDITFIPPGIPLCWVPDREKTYAHRAVDILTVSFDEEWLKECQSVFWDLDKTIFDIRRNTSASKITGTKWLKTNKILKEITESEGYNKTLNILKLLHLISEKEDLKTIAEKEVEETDIEKKHKIEVFITSNLKNKISLEEIAEYIGMNKAAFCVYFKKLYGTNFTDYVNRMRISLADDYLSNTSLSIAEVSSRCGFKTAQYFNRIYKDIKGSQPHQIRKI